MTARSLPPNVILTTDWLAANLDADWIRILDVRVGDGRPPESGTRLRGHPERSDRFVELGPNAGWVRTTPLAGRPAAPALFLEGHLPHATSFDVGRLLFDASGLVISAPELALLMSQLGVDDQHTIVLVDAGMPSTARVAADVLRRFGHAQSFVLEGGFARWLAEGRAITRQIRAFPFASFTARSGSTGAPMDQTRVTSQGRRGRDRRLTG